MKQYEDTLAFVPDLTTIYGTYTEARLLRFHDGDTFQCDVAGLPDIVGKAIEIRCQHYDTPELHDSRPEVQKLAQLAQAFVQKRLLGAKVVTLQTLKRDKYFRLLADIYIDGMPLAVDVMNAKLAHQYGGGAKNEDWTDCLKANKLI